MIGVNGPYTIWQGAIAVDGRKRTVYGKTQAEVKLKLKALSAPGPVTNGKQTVGEYLGEWIEAICPSLAPETCRSYRYIVETHLIPALGSFKLDKLTPGDVEKMLSDRMGTRRGRKWKNGLSPRSLSHLRAVLRRALGQAVKRDLLTRNVAALATAPRQVSTKEDRVILSPAEVRRLLDAAEAKDDRLRALYFVALNLGARQGELLGLLWSDVDFTRSTITINRGLQRVKVNGKGKLVLRAPKTEHSRRTVHMSPAVAAALKAHRDREETERLQAAGRWIAEPDFVFRTTIGTGCEGVNVTKEFQRAVRAAKLPRMRFHDLRHSCASILLSSGVQPLVVSKLLGHGSVTLTLNTYGHMMPSQNSEAADAMDQALAV
jgi:integrase